MSVLRKLAWLPTGICALVLGGSAPIPLGPVTPATITILVTPRPERPAFIDSTVLRFEKSWVLSSSDESFGGLSGLTVSGQDALTVSDDGTFFRLKWDGTSRTAQAQRFGLPTPCGKRERKRDQDSESLAASQEGTLWIGLEWNNRICRIKGRVAKAAAPVAMRDWPLTGGAEGLALLSDGRIAAFAERTEENGPVTPVLLFAGDPVDQPHVARTMNYSAPDGYDVSDAVTLPDGRLLILVRRFSLPFAFDAKLMLVDDPFWAEKANVPTGRPILHLAAPGMADNFEALAISRDTAGKIHLWIASDDNYLPLQKTWLLKLEVLK